MNISERIEMPKTWTLTTSLFREHGSQKVSRVMSLGFPEWGASIGTQCY